MAMARDYYPGMGDDTLAEVRWLDNEDLEFGDDADVLVAWDGTNLNILPRASDTGRVNIGNGTLLMDQRVFGSAAGNYFEYDASEDQMNIVIGARVPTGTDFALSIDATTTFAGGQNMVGLNVVMRPQDSAGLGTWLSGIYSAVVMDVDGVGGYFCAAELEVILTGAAAVSEYAVLVLNVNDSQTGGPNWRAYITTHDYGTRDMNLFLDIRELTREAANDTVMVSQMPETPFDTAIRCRVNGVLVWLYGSTVGPATVEDFQWISTAGVGNYFEYDASEDRMNIVVGAHVPDGNDIALSLDITSTFDGGDTMVGLNVVMRPQDSAGLGTWLSGIYSAVVMDVDGVGGYFCAAELEVILTGAAAVSEYAVLVLNVNDSQTGGPDWRSYITTHDYGTRDMNLFLDIRDLAIGANSAVDMVTTSGNRDQDHAIRIRLPNGTVAWLMVTQTAP